MALLGLCVSFTASFGQPEQQQPENSGAVEWYNMLEHLYFYFHRDRSLSFESRQFVLVIAGSESRVRRVALDRLTLDDKRAFQFAESVLLEPGGEPPTELFEVFMEIGRDDRRPERIRRFALSSAEFSMKTHIFGSGIYKGEEQDTDKRAEELSRQRQDSPGLSMQERAEQLDKALRQATTEMREKMRWSTEPDTNRLYESEYNTIQFGVSMLDRNVPPSVAASILIEHLRGLLRMPWASEEEDGMVAELEFLALYAIAHYAGEIEPLDEAYNRMPREPLEVIAREVVRRWDAEYAGLSEAWRRRLHSLAQKGYATTTDREPEEIFLALLDAVRSEDKLAANTAAAVLRELGAIEIGTGVLSTYLVFDPELVSTKDRLLFEAWRARVLSQAAAGVLGGDGGGGEGEGGYPSFTPETP